jgi:hypothetical protein
MLYAPFEAPKPGPRRHRALQLIGGRGRWNGSVIDGILRSVAADRFSDIRPGDELGGASGMFRTHDPQSESRRSITG